MEMGRVKLIGTTNADINYRNFVRKKGEEMLHNNFLGGHPS